MANPQNKQKTLLSFFAKKAEQRPLTSLASGDGCEQNVLSCPFGFSTEQVNKGPAAAELVGVTNDNAADSRHPLLVECLQSQGPLSETSHSEEAQPKSATATIAKHVVCTPSAQSFDTAMMVNSKSDSLPVQAQCSAAPNRNELEVH